MSDKARAVELSQLCKRFGATFAVKPLDLVVQAGEFLTLLGPSGCGKTTLLRMIAGLETSTGGEIRIGGDIVTNRPPHQRNCGIMFQDYALFPHMSLVDNIAYGLKMRGIGRGPREALAREWLVRIGLPEYGARLPHELSGGQRQRVALARALIIEPGVLLLDEPLGALDAGIRRQMQVELKRMHREIGLTFIYVTHDQEEALNLSDRIAVMNAGGVEQLATPVALYDRPTTEFVARFVGACNILVANVASESGGLLAKCSEIGAHLLLASPCQPQDTIRLALRPEKIRVLPASPEAPNRVAAVVMEILFGGATIRLRVETKGGSIMEAAPGRGEGFIEQLAPGMAVALAWEPEALNIVSPSVDVK